MKPEQLAALAKAKFKDTIRVPSKYDQEIGIYFEWLERLLKGEATQEPAKKTRRRGGRRSD